MFEIPKAERILRLIRLLNERKRTVRQLAELLSTIPRNVYRDLDNIRNVGYLIHCDEESRYALEENPAASRAHFTIEETKLIRQHLSALSTVHPLKSSIERKLYLSSELIPLADELSDKHRAVMISRINSAILESKQIRLVRYHSNNSSTIEDRIVEPISLSDDFAILNAFEVSSQKQKTFKVARLEDVQVLISDNESRMESQELDIFGFSGSELLPVVIRLSFLAYQLLFEEFPSSRAYLVLKGKDEKFPYEFRGEVRDFRGIGRYILGLPGEIQIANSPGLKEYLKERAGKAEW